MFDYAEDWRNGCMFSFLGGVVAWWRGGLHTSFCVSLADVSVCCVIVSAADTVARGGHERAPKGLFSLGLAFRFPMSLGSISESRIPTQKIIKS